MSIATQDNCAFILRCTENGDRIRFFQDFYGVQYAEVVPKWQFWRKIRVRLDPAEYARLKQQLKTFQKSA